MSAIASHALGLCLIGYFAAGSLFWYVLTVLDIVQTSHAQRLRRGDAFALLHTVLATGLSILLWPKVARQLFRHPKLGRALASYLWGRG